jgi:hypothetical protein
MGRRQNETLHLIKELVAERKHKLLIAFEEQAGKEGAKDTYYVSVRGWVCRILFDSLFFFIHLRSQNV